MLLFSDPLRPAIFPLYAADDEAQLCSESGLERIIWPPMVLYVTFTSSLGGLCMYRCTEEI